MKLVALDTETFLVNTRGKATTKTVPRLVCLSVAEEGRPAELFERERAVHVAKALFERDDVILVGHNVAFDVLVLVRALHEELDFDLLPRVFELYNEGRIRDTMVREKLYDISKGGLYRRGGYGLKDLAKRILKETIKGKSGPDAWRMRYNELDGLHVDQYPKAAYEYAVLDADYTLRIYQAREFVLNEDFQTTAAFCLNLISAWGVRIDLEWASEVDAFYAREENELLADLVATGLADKSGKIPTKRKQALVADGFASLGIPAPLTPTGAIATNKKAIGELEEGLKAAGFDFEKDRKEDGWFSQFVSLMAYNRARKFRSTYLEPMLDAAEADAPLCARYNELVDSWRTSSQSPNLQNIVSRLNPAEKAKLKELQEIVGDKKLTPIERMRHPDGFVVGPDIRGCVIAREGKVLIGADYSAIEMAGLAQNIKNWRGKITALGESINAGEDQHLRIVAPMRGIPYSEAVRLYEDYLAAEEEGRVAIDPTIDFDRFLGKCFHPDTEVLTVSGWKRIPDLVEGEAVMAAIPEDGTQTTRLEWQVPTGYHRKTDYTELVHIDSQDMKLAVTADHGIPTWTRQGTYQREEAGGDFWPSDRLVKCAGLAGEYEPSYLVPLGATVTARLAIAVQADGSYDEYQNIRFGFTKPSKARRLRRLLNLGGIEFTEQVKSFGGKIGWAFYLPHRASAEIRALLDEDKTLSWRMIGLPAADRIAIIEEAAFWDSTIIGEGRSYHYSSTIEKNVDVLSAIAAITGAKAKQLPPYAKDDPNHATCYSVAIADRDYSRTGNYKVERRPYDGEVYCLSVPSGAVLVRYRGATSIAHQSANYGFSGGASAETWVEYCAQMGAKVTLTTAQRVRDAWFTAWPEMYFYRDMISSFQVPGGEYECHLHGPNGQTSGWGVRIAPRFTSAMNTFFQNIVSSGCKYALWLLQQACYVDKSSPLFGCRVVIFEHDAFYLEADEGRAEEAAPELERLMVEGMSLFIPDILVEAKAKVLGERWSA